MKNQSKSALQEYKNNVKKIVYKAIQKLFSMGVYVNNTIGDNSKEVAIKVMSVLNEKDLEKALGVKEITMKQVINAVDTIRSEKRYIFTNNSLKGKQRKESLKKQSGQVAKEYIERMKIVNKKQLTGIVRQSANGLLVLEVDDAGMEEYTDMVLEQNDRTRSCIGKRVGVKLIKNTVPTKLQMMGVIDWVFDESKDLTSYEKLLVETMYKHEIPMFHLYHTKKPFAPSLSGEELELYLQSQEELKNIPDEVTQKDIDNAIKEFGEDVFKDFRDIPVFTCDPPYARDVDDGIHVKEVDGKYVITVPIAFVGMYVKEDSACAQIAMKYMPSSAYPGHLVSAMFDKKLSNGICSLNEGVDRFALVGQFVLDKNYNILEYSFNPGVIRSRKKMSYNEVDAIAEGKDVPGVPQDVVDSIKLLKKIEKEWRPLREKNGTINFITRDVNFIVDDDCNVLIGYSKDNDTFAHKGVESLMLLYNKCIAEYCEEHDIPILFRIQPPFSENDIENIREYCAKQKIPFEFDGDYSDTGKVQSAINKSIEYARKKGVPKGSKEENELFAQVFCEGIVKLSPRAAYSVENSGHAALAYEKYTHGTSPIRRLVDWMMQLNYIAYKQNKPFPFSKETLADIAEKINEFERQTDGMSQEVINKQAALFVKQTLESKGFPIQEGYVSKIIGNEMVVATDITDVKVEVQPKIVKIKGGGVKRIYPHNVGDRVQMQYTKTDIHNGVVYGALVAEKGEKRREFDPVM